MERTLNPQYPVLVDGNAHHFRKQNQFLSWPPHTKQLEWHWRNRKQAGYHETALCHIGCRFNTRKRRNRWSKASCSRILQGALRVGGFIKLVHCLIRLQFGLNACLLASAWGMTYDLTIGYSDPMKCRPFFVIRRHTNLVHRNSVEILEYSFFSQRILAAGPPSRVHRKKRVSVHAYIPGSRTGTCTGIEKTVTQVADLIL